MSSSGLVTILKTLHQSKRAVALAAMGCPPEGLLKLQGQFQAYVELERLIVDELGKQDMDDTDVIGETNSEDLDLWQ